MTLKFTPNDHVGPVGKLADAELHFNGGPLDGLRLVGFSVWERKNGDRSVTFPVCHNRGLVLLRPISESSQQAPLRDLILDAFREFETDLRLLPPSIKASEVTL